MYILLCLAVFLHNDCEFHLHYLMYQSVLSLYSYVLYVYITMYTCIFCDSLIHSIFDKHLYFSSLGVTMDKSAMNFLL